MPCQQCPQRFPPRQHSPSDTDTDAHSSKVSAFQEMLYLINDKLYITDCGKLSLLILIVTMCSSCYEAYQKYVKDYVTWASYHVETRSMQWKALRIRKHSGKLLFQESSVRFFELMFARTQFANNNGLFDLNVIAMYN